MRPSKSAAKTPKKQNASKERIVIKLSGSIFSQDATQLARISLLLAELDTKFQLIAIAGGGKIARHYITMARQFGLDEASLDIMGIEVSRLNAKLLAAAVESTHRRGQKDRASIVYHAIPKDLEQVAAAVSSGKMVITGGLHPGQSTNATAALIAEKVGANMFLNATDVDGIYSADPRKNPDARMFKEITVSKCLELLGSENSAAGSYDLMDIVALKVIERSKIPTIVLKSDIDAIRGLLLGNKVTGTRIIA